MSLVRELGLLNACFYVLDRIMRGLSAGCVRLHKYYFLAQPVPERAWLPPRRGASLEVRRLFPDDPALLAFPRPARAYPYRFEQGAVCLGAFKSAAPIGFLWFVLSHYEEDEVRCRYVLRPEGKAAWDFDVYVAPEHRAGPAFLRLWDEANRLLKSQSVAWSFSRVSAYNAPSIASHARMGASRIGSVVFATVGPWQLSMATVRPYVFLSRNTTSVPVFRLDAQPIENHARAIATSHN